MLNESTDRRRATRVPVRVEATMLVLFPEETFTPQPLYGQTLDLSMSGMRFCTRQASDDFYRLVIRGVRHAKIEVQLPGLEQCICFQGRIVWVDFDNMQDPPSCLFGISLDALTSGQKQALETCIANLTKGIVSTDGIGPGKLIQKSNG